MLLAGALDDRHEARPKHSVFLSIIPGVTFDSD
jgi:hypothetical protein